MSKYEKALLAFYGVVTIAYLCAQWIIMKSQMTPWTPKMLRATVELRDRERFALKTDDL